ncbi:MAG: YigZ family protein, partial [Rhodothermales bacterium]
MTRLATARMQESSANHHCWAYRIGPEGEQYRFNDDGEPSGTAGPPILQQIAGRNVVDIIVIITRYFGGTLLGTGGLIRAYG